MFTVNLTIAGELVTVILVAADEADPKLPAPVTKLQLVLLTASPGLGAACPETANTLPHCVWLGPALATPICNATCFALIKSTMVAVGDGEVFVLIKSVFTPRLVHGSIAPSKAVRSIAASTKRLTEYWFAPNAGNETGTVPALVAANTEPAGVMEVLST